MASMRCCVRLVTLKYRTFHNNLCKNISISIEDTFEENTQWKYRDGIKCVCFFCMMLIGTPQLFNRHTVRWATIRYTNFIRDGMPFYWKQQTFLFIYTYYSQSEKNISYRFRSEFIRYFALRNVHYWEKLCVRNAMKRGLVVNLHGNH